MASGRKPTPPELQKLKGDTRNHGVHVTQQGIDSAPQPQGDVRAPAWLSKAARKVWEELAPEMIRCQILRMTDVKGFAEWCEVVVEIRETQRKIKRTGLMLKTRSSGAMRANPLLAHLSRLRDQMMKLGAEHGLTPSSRARVAGVKAAGAGMGKPKAPEDTGSRLRDRAKLVSFAGGRDQAPKPEPSA